MTSHLIMTIHDFDWTHGIQETSFTLLDMTTAKAKTTFKLLFQWEKSNKVDYIVYGMNFVQEFW